MRPWQAQQSRESALAIFSLVIYFTPAPGLSLRYLLYSTHHPSRSSHQASSKELRVEWSEIRIARLLASLR